MLKMNYVLSLVNCHEMTAFFVLIEEFLGRISQPTSMIFLLMYLLSNVCFSLSFYFSHRLVRTANLLMAFEYRL